MNKNTTLLSRLEFEPLLLPGGFVHILPDSKWGFYYFPRDQIVEPLPPKTVNMAAPFTSALSALNDTGGQNTLESEVDDLDMPRLNLAQYRLVAIDDVLFTVKQPSAIGRFNNIDGPVPFGKETQIWLDQGMWSMLPEIFIFQDMTRPTIKVQNTKYRTTYYARFAAFGFRYVLEEVTSRSEIEGNSNILEDLKSGKQPALTLSVEGTGN